MFTDIAELTTPPDPVDLEEFYHTTTLLNAAYAGKMPSMIALTQMCGFISVGGETYFYRMKDDPLNRASFALLEYCRRKFGVDGPDHPKAGLANRLFFSIFERQCALNHFLRDCKQNKDGRLAQWYHPGEHGDFIVEDAFLEAVATAPVTNGRFDADELFELAQKTNAKYDAS